MPFQFKDSLPYSVDDQSPSSPKNYRQDGQSNVFKIKPFKTVLWSDVEGLMVKVQLGGSTWIIESIEAVSSTSATPIWVMLDHKEVISIPVDRQHFLPIKPYKDIPVDPADGLSEPERCCIEKLMNHLVNNSFHYKK
jgi:hypothetical protein